MGWKVTGIRQQCHICKKDEKGHSDEGEAEGRDQQGTSASQSPPKIEKKMNGGLGMYVSMQKVLSSVSQHPRNQTILIILALKVKVSGSEG